MKSILYLFALLSFATLPQQSTLFAQPCNLCGTTASEWIEGITINGGSGFFLNPPGGGAGGCAGKTVIDAYIAVLKKGVSHPFTLTPGFTGAAQSEYWKIWIDLNHDGDFDDTGDLVYASVSGATTTVGGSFFIPLSVAAGPAAMRVAMRRGSPPPDCGNFTNGQVLDYNSIYLDECDVSFYDACAREYIKQVNIQTINNSTGCGNSGYQDFTNLSATLNAGNAYPLQLTPGFFNVGQYPERWLVWIDFNSDYDFDDPGEQVFDSGAIGSTTTTTGTVNIPSNAQTATTRMRIKMIPTDVNTVTLDPCDPIGPWFWPDQYGEAEDYTVNIKGVTLEVQGAAAADLVKDVLFGGNCFDVKNVTYSGQPSQIGSFSNGLPNVGFNTGVIIATGNIAVAPGPNESNGASGGYGISTPDADLATLTTGASFDMANIEFDFTPTQSPFTFEFVFASEEYCEYVNTQFGDVFGFFISGPGINGTKNLALVPNTNLPITLNTINHLTNSGYYIHNTPASGDNCGNIPPANGPAVQGLQYDGFTSKIVSVVNVIPCSTYHIKLKVADVGDGVWDSAVFLKGGSFDGGGNAAISWLVNGEPAVNEVVEGCGTVQLQLDRLGSNTSIPLPVSFSISGTATSGADFSPISSTYVIPAGVEQVEIPISIFSDLIPEGAETIHLTLNNACSCINPQESLTILDYTPIVANADTITIPGPGVASMGVTVQGGITPYAYQWSNGATTSTITPFIGTSSTFTVTVTDACGKTSSSNASVLINNASPPFTVIPTGRNHTIIIPDTLRFEIMGGGNLQIGDQIAVFYDSAATGVFKCGGQFIWQNQTTTVAVYGNDATPPARNGFNTGEVFIVKIWRSASNQLYDATALYAPVGWLGGLITHTNAFADDGISMINSIVVGTTQAIPLNAGWNLISSYVAPNHADMAEVFGPIVSSVDIVKKCDGASYIPLLMINGIGNWNIGSGYQVKANKKDTLLITGQQVAPQSSPITLNTGWNCIGYLRKSPMNISTVFSAIQGQISLVKNNEGKIYSPQFGINTIGNMMPGQGYKVKVISNCTLLYQPNFSTPPLEEREKTELISSPVHFSLTIDPNSGNNATIILVASIAQNLIHYGDEIGVFSASGLLCGAAFYHGENIGITVWGDDPSTTGIIEGMQIGESYIIKVWNNSQQEEYAALTSFQNGLNTYAPDAIEIIENMGIASNTKDLTAAGIQILQLYPNPTPENLNVDISSKSAGKFVLTVYSTDGSQILDAKEIEYAVGNTIYTLHIPAYLPPGVYWLKFQFEKGMLYRQLLLLE